MRYDSAELRCLCPRRRELENRCWPTRGGSGAHPTAIAIVYCSTESIPGAATHRLGTSSSCVLSANASPGKPNTTRRFWLPDRQAVNRFRQPDKKGISHDNVDGRGTDAMSVLHAMPSQWTVSSPDGRALVPALEAALVAGWTTETLAAHLSRQPEGVHYPARVLTRRLAEIPGPPTPSQPECAVVRSLRGFAIAHHHGQSVGWN